MIAKCLLKLSIFAVSIYFFILITCIQAIKSFLLFVFLINVDTYIVKLKFNDCLYKYTL